MTLPSPYADPPPAPPGAAFDEFWEAPGVPRAHQKLLHEYVTARSPADLERLRQVVRRRMSEQAVTFNILGVPDGANRPWQLDSLPFVLAREDWATLREGLRQRARLLDAVLRDVYGPETLLRRGLLPPEIVHKSPRFLRPCHGWEPPRGTRLVFYAADVGRDASGAFHVFSDRTAAPTGAGYALENRLVLGRALGELFRAYPVDRLSEFFGKARRALEQLARPGAGEPRIVLLTAGAGDESSFEHAYLARYLGYELVEGRDLTVRENAVFLKTLAGLRRVDVVFRRVFDEWCDPLYFRPDSAQGAAALTSAAAAGTVSLANPLGSGFAETPALRCFLPALAREVLGEELRLPDVPVFWCGDAGSLAHVLSSLEDFVLKPAYAERRGPVVRPALLDAPARKRLVERLKAFPDRYIAESWPELSVAPCLRGTELSQGKVSLRTFLCRDGADYHVMPGGLARLDSDPDGLFLPSTADGVSQDVWIPAPEPSTRSIPLPAMTDVRVELRRGGVDLPSRLLDDIYWLGRYVERCDLTARLVRAGLDRLGFESGPDAPRALDAVLHALRELGAVLPPVPSNDTAPGGTEAQLLAAVSAPTLSGSVVASVTRIRELTLGVRSRLSRDAWHVLHRLSSSLTGLDTYNVGSVAEALDELLVTLAAVSGTTFDNMVRGHLWIFLDMGRRVERGSCMLMLLRVLLPPGAARVHMEALLEVADSLLTYRARYLSSLQAAPVVDLLLTDDTNPRSVAFQVGALRDHLDKLPRVGGAVRTRAERRLIALGAQLLTADVEQACGGDGQGLRQLVEDASNLMWQFSDDLSQTWFSHAAPAHPLSPPEWVDEDLDGS